MLPTNPLLNATAPAGPHLPVALLRQYAAGTLAPAAQHRVEAHTLACSRCADILEGLLQTPPTTTDQALAQLQQRLRQRVQQQAAPARLAQRPRRHYWLAPQLATAAALLLAMLAAGWWAWQQRQPTTARVAHEAPPRPVVAPTPPAPAAVSPVTAVASVPSVAITRPAPTASAAPTKQRPATAHVAAGRAATHANKTSTASNQPLVADLPVAAPDSAMPAAGLAVAVAPTPASPAKASEPTARLRATMPPPPALAASPTGGYATLHEYLKKGTAEFEPETPDGPRRSGRVLVRLHIGADGKIEQAEAIRKLRPDYDAEAIRLLQEGPAWVPGISGGRRAAQTVDVPVLFE